MKNPLLTLCVLLCCAGPATAAVVLTEDGTVHLGNVVSVDAQSLVIDSFGRQVRLPTGSILSNAKDVNALKGVRLDVRLKDGSVISGFVENYDDEIGLLVNIGFGNLTIPVKSIAGMVEPRQRLRYYGAAVRAGAWLGPASVSGSLGSSFGGHLGFAAYLEGALPWARGLALGVDLAVRALRYTADPDVDYMAISLRPYVSWAFLDFKKGGGLFSGTTPFVSLAVGLAYVRLTDGRDSVKVAGVNEMNLELAFSGGADFVLAGPLSLRCAVSYALIPQGGASFAELGFQFGCNYGF